MRRLSPQERKQYAKLGLLIASVGLIIGALTLLCMPFFEKIGEPEFQQQFQRWVYSLGWKGCLILLGIQILQIIIAFIPGEPVELLAGALYGAWGGLAICLAGILLASTAIFFVVRKLGYPVVVRIFGKEKLDEFKFFNSAEKAEAVTFILFLIPGTPKDMLTYLAGISRIKPSTFLFLSTFARVPSVITSTLMGATMSSGNWGMTVLIFLLTAAIGLVGILYKDRILHQLRREKNP